MPDEFLPKPQSDLPLPVKDLPLPEKDLPLPEKEIPSHATQINRTENNKKPKFSLLLKSFLIGILFISLLILMEGGLYLTKKSDENSSKIPAPAPLAQISPAADPTAEWMSYKGDNFSFRHPSSWSVDSTKSTNIIIGPVSMVNDIGSTVPKYVNPYIRLTILTSPLNTDLVKYSKLDKNAGAVWEKINIDNIEGFMVKHESCASEVCRNVYLQYKNKIYVFTEENDLVEFEQLLSTFKFNDHKLTCTPRPACLDANPGCKMAETADMCPPTPKPTSENNMIICTQEAKLCPDGKTYVGRSGPKCEFEKCPEE